MCESLVAGQRDMASQDGKFRGKMHQHDFPCETGLWQSSSVAAQSKLQQ